MKLQRRTHAARPALLAALTQGRSLVVACREAGIVPATVRVWRRAGDPEIEAAIAAGLRARADALERALDTGG